jgi:hypothetical protein
VEDLDERQKCRLCGLCGLLRTFAETCEHHAGSVNILDSTPSLLSFLSILGSLGVKRNMQRPASHASHLRQINVLCEENHKLMSAMCLSIVPLTGTSLAVDTLLDSHQSVCMAGKRVRPPTAVWKQLRSNLASPCESQ